MWVINKLDCTSHHIVVSPLAVCEWMRNMKVEKEGGRPRSGMTSSHVYATESQTTQKKL